MGARLRVGFLDVYRPDWTGGGAFSRMLASSLAAAAGAHVEMTLISDRRDPPAWARQLGMRCLRAPDPSFGAYLPGEVRLRNTLGLPARNQAEGLERLVRLGVRPLMKRPPAAVELAETCGVDVILPLQGLERRTHRVKYVGWIPDFQPARLPQYFSAQELAERERRVTTLVHTVDTLLLSSHAAHRDQQETLPEVRCRVEVLPFPSLFAFGPAPDADVAAVRARYNLPERWALVANQFWAHKNHAVVIEALALLKARGRPVSVVMTGLPLDGRSPENTPLSQLLQLAATRDVRENLWLLGLVPQQDLVALVRGAALAIQPSRFEGWSTTLQDALALGRPVVCSDIPVHREQAPGALGFFAPDDAEGLARLLDEHWPGLAAGPDVQAEAAALERERAMAARHGERFFEVLMETVGRR